MNVGLLEMDGHSSCCSVAKLAISVSLIASLATEQRGVRHYYGLIRLSQRWAVVVLLP